MSLSCWLILPVGLCHIPTPQMKITLMQPVYWLGYFAIGRLWWIGYTYACMSPRPAGVAISNSGSGILSIHALLAIQCA